MRYRWLAGWTLVLCSCDSRTVSPDGASDAPWTADARLDSRRFDARIDPPDMRPRDATPADMDACYCPSNQVWLRGACVPTLELGCGPGCDPTLPQPCPAGETCDPWAASTCCMCAAAVPACVKQTGTGPIYGPLRMSPVSGVAGQAVTFIIEGAPFYVGALFYKVRMGSLEKMEEAASKPCTIAATFTPPTPGIHVVEVSQYGGGPPWVLAGFFTASGGSIPLPTIQPGFPCSMNPAPGDPACAQTAPYSCSCVGGRCMCK